MKNLLELSHLILFEISLLFLPITIPRLFPRLFLFFQTPSQNHESETLSSDCHFLHMLFHVLLENFQ